MLDIERDSMVDAIAAVRLEERVANAAAEWQARSCGYQSITEGGLTTQAACSEVSHHNRQRLQTLSFPAGIRVLTVSFYTRDQYQTQSGVPSSA